MRKIAQALPAEEPQTESDSEQQDIAEVRQMRAYLGLADDDVKSDSPNEPMHIRSFTPHSYVEARVIGEHYRRNQPVLANLTEISDADAKRLVDFMAGLTFGRHGRIERITNKTFLLTPSPPKDERAQQSAFDLDFEALWGTTVRDNL